MPTPNQIRSRQPRHFAEPLEPRRLLATFNAALPVAGAGTNVQHVAAADFNNDGFADIAVANVNAAGTVSIRLGTSTPGTFTSAANVTVGNFPIYVTTADFNNDGYADLATANNDIPGTVSVALGTGLGTFAAATTLSVGNAPLSVTTGDFNNDGNLDLVAANGTIDTLSLLRGNGNGTFLAAISVVIGDHPYEVVAADFNNDGKLDLASTRINAGVVAVVLGTGAGTFGAAANVTVGSSPRGLVAADFNKDGKVDFAAATQQGGGTVQVALGNGNGTFGAVSGVATGSTLPVSVVAADLDGDGRIDLAVANAFTNNVALLTGTGSGAFNAAAAFSVAPNSAGSLAVGDFNADTKPDLVVGNSGGTAVTILPGNGVGLFVPASPPTVTVGTQPFTVAAADFNGDGHVDLATANGVDGTVSVRLGNGNGTFVNAPNPTLTVGSASAIVVTGDFNADGKIDLAVARQTSPGTVTIFLGNGDGTFTLGTVNTVGNSPGGIAVGDFNGDGKSDLAVGSNVVNTVSILIGLGNGTFAPAASIAVATGVSSVATGDFNGDGKTDLVGTNNVASSATILTGVGDGTFTVGTPVSVVSAARPATGDFNGDGMTDLAIAEFAAAGRVSVRLGNGNGTFAAPRFFATGGSPVGLFAVDFDGDGKLDLAVANRGGGGSVSVLSGAGNGTFGRAATYFVGASVQTLAVSDFDGDGRADLATAHNGSITTTSIILGRRAYRTAYVKADTGVLSLDGNFSVTLALNYDPAAGVVSISDAVVGGTERLLAVGLTGVAAFAIADVIANFDLGRFGGGRATDLNVLAGSIVTATTSQHLGAITNTGRLVLTPGGNKVLSTTAFNFTASNGTRIDLNDNAMVLNYVTPGTAATNQVRSAIAKGRNGGDWFGTYGLLSESASTRPGLDTTLGYMEATDYKAIYGANAKFLGETLDNTAVVIRYTLYGDANFDRKVDFNDFIAIQTNYSGVASTTAQGDFDNNGTTDFNDFIALQINYGQAL